METDYLKQLQEIQATMNRSTRFLSLSGLSGVLAGTLALIGAFIAHEILKANHYQVYLESAAFMQLILIASSVLGLSLIIGIVLTHKKAKKTNASVWNTAAKRFIINLAIPLLTGGAFAFILILRGYFGFIAPITLIFYGLALVNASRYTIETIRSLGLIFIVLGLFNAYYLGYGLYFWAFGFGFCHIIYGTLMYFKHDKK